MNKFMKNIVPGSFTWKIFLVQAFSILILSVVFTGYFILRERQAMAENLQEQGKLLARQLADNCRIGVFAENSELLDLPIRSALAQKDVLGALVFTSEGKMLSTGNTQHALSSNRDSKEKEFSIPVSLPTPKPGFPIALRKPGLIEFWSPIQSAMHFSPEEALIYTDTPDQESSRIIGYAAVILDTSRLDASYRNLLVKSIAICLVFLLTSFWVAYRLAHGITRPLNSLKEQVTALGKGITMEKMAVERCDEIGELTGAFNAMAEALHAREEEKEHLEEQLRQAQKMEAIGQLAGGVAHDFNNILCAIIGFGTLLEMGMSKEDPSRRHLEQILSAADRATSLTQGLLTFSRKQIINPHPADLNAIVQHIEKMLKRLISEDIELHISLSGKELSTLVDTGQIDQVLLNLATNARDAMPTGGTLTIVTEEAPLPDDLLADSSALPTTRYALLSVSDTGAGMDKETREKIFEPFFTTKDIGKGTGLGLSMVYGIVKQHNGHIAVNSAPGKGTTFLIYLPLTPKENLPPDTSGLPSQPVAGSETLLVAEDNPEVLNLNRTVLETFGYKIIEAVDGEDAVKQFIEHQQDIDMIVMDVVMPKMNGQQAYEEIAKIRPDVKVLFMSGYTPDIVQEKGITTDGLNFVHKPVTPMQMLKKIRELLDSQPKQLPGRENEGF